MSDFRVYKYTLRLEDSQVVRMPAGARPLSVGEQHGALCLWALHDVSALPVERVVHIIGTGHPADGVAKGWVDDCPYVGTVLMHAGQFVWHVFVEQEKPA